MSEGIHPLACVDPGAKLGDGVNVGPFAVIEADTEIGDGTRIAAHAVIKRYSKIGARNRIHEGAVIGGEPQDYKFGGWVSHVEIGDDNRIREGVTIHRSSKEGGVTRVGSNNFLMAFCHIAHDCLLGNNIVIANATLLGGHVEIEDRAFISGAVTIHQFCRIGTLAMVGGNARVTQDCLPYIITEGLPAQARALNLVGIKRAGFSREDMQALKRAYMALRAGTSLDASLESMDSLGVGVVDRLATFIRASKRGFAHPA